MRKADENGTSERERRMLPVDAIKEEEASGEGGGRENLTVTVRK